MAGQPLPPPPAPAVARVPPANVAGLRARPFDGAVQLEWRTVTNATRYVVMRSDRAGASSLVYDGRATTFVDRGLVNGEEYRYVVVTYDAAGLRSVGVAVVAVPARPVLSTPKHGAAVSRPPLLTWRALRRQVLQRAAAPHLGRRRRHEGAQPWPVKNRFQLRRTWRYAGKTQRLTPGTYEWYVWAGWVREPHRTTAGCSAGAASPSSPRRASDDASWGNQRSPTVSRRRRDSNPRRRIVPP